MEITDLRKDLNSGINEFIGKTIQISGNGLFLNENSLTFISSLSFHDCIFKGSHLEFENIEKPDFLLGFFDCTFQISIDFKNCNLKRLGFRDCKSEKKINIIEGTYSNFYLRNTNPKTKVENVFSGDLYISDIKVEENISMDNLNIISDFYFSENILSFSEKKSTIKFKNSTFNNAHFLGNHFHSIAYFDNFEITGLSVFYSCEFQKLNFKKSYLLKCTFDKCNFSNTTLFEECRNLKNSELKFVDCEFEKHTKFDNSKFNKIEILHSTFREKVSFENFETNYFKIHQVTFAEAAYFDDLNKSNEKAVENWDRKTLRAIKRELVNTHNQIDYLRFKAYELNAFNKEKDITTKDQIILFFNRHSNYFGLDWTRGICFILKTSLMFYLLYLITFIIEIKDTSCLPQTCEEFGVTYIKFLNPVSFLKTPIEEAEKYFFPLLFLNLSKIFVSYGIYQTIQAFRKFGVNGG